MRLRVRPVGRKCSSGLRREASKRRSRRCSRTDRTLSSLLSLWTPSTRSRSKSSGWSAYDSSRVRTSARSCARRRRSGAIIELATVASTGCSAGARANRLFRCRWSRAASSSSARSRPHTSATNSSPRLAMSVSSSWWPTRCSQRCQPATMRTVFSADSRCSTSTAPVTSAVAIAERLRTGGPASETSIVTGSSPSSSRAASPRSGATRPVSCRLCTVQNIGSSSPSTSSGGSPPRPTARATSRRISAPPAGSPPTP